MAASLDGATIYCVASRVVWAIPAKEGNQKGRRKIWDGDGVAVDPRNGDLIVQLFGKDAVQLLRLPAQGGPEQPITFSSGSFFAYPIPLSPNAVGKDGRILMQGGAKDTWSYRVGLIDPARKSVEIVPLAFDGDPAAPGWTKDGKIVSLGIPYRPSLWRFSRVNR